jgi:DNA-binding beta-propeller fold protein YncE
MSTIIKRQVGWISAIALGLLMQAAFADKLYVSGSNDIDVIDTDSNSMISTIYYRNNPNHTGSAWLYENNDLSLTKPMLSMPVVNPEGTRLYAIRALHDTTVSFPFYDYNSELVVLDTKTDNILSVIPLSCQPLFDQYVTNVINPSGTRLYVVCKDRGSVAVIDTTINKEVALLPDSSYFESGVFDSSGALLYVKHYDRNNYLDNKVAVFNANTGSLTSSISLDDGTFATPYIGSIVTTGTRLYAMFQNTDIGNTIQVINMQSNQVIGSIPVSTDIYHIQDMQVNFEGTRLYACAMRDILVFNLISNRLETSIPLVDGSCSAIAINASGTRIYVLKDQSVSYNRVIHVIDTESNKIVSTISLNPTGGGGKIAVVSSATITPIPSATVHISNLNTQAQLPIIGGFGISGMGRLTLLFQGSTATTCIDSSMTLRKYPSGEVVTKLKNGILTPHYSWTYEPGYLWLASNDYNDLLHRSTVIELQGNPQSNNMNIFMWSLPVGYYIVSLDTPERCDEGKLNIDIIEENSSSSAKLTNFSANAILPITSSVTLKGTGSIQTMFRGFKVTPCIDANLELRNSPSGMLLASNDNWETDVNVRQAKMLPNYLQPIDSSDAGLLRYLFAQSITATLTSKNTCQGDGVFGVDVTHDAVVDDLFF